MTQLTRMMTPMLLIVAFIVVLLATMTGVSHGLDATSVQEAKIVPGQDYNLSNGTDAGELNASWDPMPVIPDSWQSGPLKPKPPSDRMREQFVKPTVRVVMAYSSAVSVFTYHNQRWVKEWWVAPLFNILVYLPPAAVLAYSAYVLLKVKEAFRGAAP